MRIPPSMLANENAEVGQLSDTVTRYAYQGAGAYGPVFAAVGTDIAASIEPTQKMVVGRDGRDVLCDAKAAVGPDAEAAIGDKITWRDASYQVVSLAEYRYSGQSYYKELMLRTLGGD